MILPPPTSTLFPYTTLFRSDFVNAAQGAPDNTMIHMRFGSVPLFIMPYLGALKSGTDPDRKSTRLNSSHTVISYAVFCLKKKTYHSSTTAATTIAATSAVAH